ncbi:MAG: hypothetical protein K6F14_01000, partial [Clostridiales bacterium]|nr:hypothetical protein [Clostridiales bacterium]
MFISNILSFYIVIVKPSDDSPKSSKPVLCFMNLHMWTGDGSYYIDTEDEFKQRTGFEDLGESSDGLTMTM